MCDDVFVGWERSRVHVDRRYRGLHRRSHDDSDDEGDVAVPDDGMLRRAIRRRWEYWELVRDVR